MVKTRKSLWAAGFALLVCILLLIGTTFAWFTDSVSNSGNKIQAGSLEVSFAEFDPAEEGYVNVGKEPIFNYDKWEPGYTDVACVKIGNEGTLALKYQLDIIVDGDVGNLADVIDVYYVADSTARTALPADTTGMQYIGTLSQVLNNASENGVAHGNLLAGEADFATIALHMKESAGNEYQGASIGTTFDIVLNATQLTHETDGFGSEQYDADAQYPEIHRVDANTDLSDLVNNPGVPVEITATENMMYQKNFSITGDVTMNLDTNTINRNGMQIVGTDITVKNGGKLTINAEANSDGFTYTAGKLIVDGSDSVLTVNGGRYGDSGYRNSEISARNGGTVYINEGIFSTSGAEGHAVTAEADSTIYINGGSFSTSGANSITIYANGGTIVIEKIDSLTANGSRYGVDNGGKILVSKEYSSSAPKSLASGCTVTEDGDGYWLITKN